MGSYRGTNIYRFAGGGAVVVVVMSFNSLLWVTKLGIGCEFTGVFENCGEFTLKWPDQVPV